MTIAVFRDRVRIGSSVVVNKTVYRVVQIITSKPDLIAVAFEGGGLLYADPREGEVIFGEETRVPFGEPFPEHLFFQGREFNFVRETVYRFEESFGEGPFCEGEGSRMRIYRDGERSVLVLHRFKDGTACDLSGRLIPESWITIV